MQFRWNSSWQRISAATRWTIGIVATVVAGVLLFLGLCRFHFMAGPASRMASHAMHRKVQIGQLSAEVLRSEPTITVQNLRIANPSWAKAPYLATIRSITIAIEPWQLLRDKLVLARLQIEDPELSLERDAQGQANWDFSTPSGKPAQPNKAKAGALPRLPAVKLFTMRGGSVHVEDAVRKLQFQGQVVANEHAERPAEQPLGIQGHGDLNGKPFQLQFHGSALFDLQLDQPYRFDSTIVAGSLTAAARGQVDRPFDFAHFGATVDLSGQNLAGLYYLTGIALPFTPPFHLHGVLRNDSAHFTLADLRATIGSSDIEGSVRVDAAGPRADLIAELSSRSLSLSDLAPSFGAGVTENSAQAGLQAPSATKTAHGLLPTYHFQFDEARKSDARVHLHADSIQTRVPIKALDLGVQLDHGVLTLQPIQLTLPAGQVSGAISIDARQSSALAALDVRVRDVQLAQFKPAKAPAAPVVGTLESRLQLKGHGNSVHDIMASSSGLVTAVVPGGSIRKSFVELAGVNVARGLGLVLSGSQQQTSIRCGVMAFTVHDGLATAHQFVISTATVRINGKGDFNFGTEKLDLVLQGHPTHFSLVHLAVPVVIDGTFTKPAFAVKPGGLLAQAGIAAALGVLATPAAALLAFVDQGLSKNADCSALLSAPQPESAEHPGLPHASPHEPVPKAPPARGPAPGG